MARIQPAQYDPEWDEGGGGGRGRRTARYAVPVAVAGVAAATIGLVPALADSGDPSLPSITAQQLLANIAGSKVQAVNGTVQVTTDLGLPSALSGGAAGSLFQGAATPGKAGGDSTSPAAPQAQLTQLLIGSHTLHVAADGPDRQKVSLIEPAAEYSVIRNGTQLWAYDSQSNQAYHQTLPQQRDQQRGRHSPQAPDGSDMTPQDIAKQLLKEADGTASITVEGTARVAGRSAYELVVRPQHAPNTTVGAIRVAVDAKTWVPLKTTVDPRGGGKAVFDIHYTKVSFTAPAASTFDFKPGKGVKVTQGGNSADHADRHGTSKDNQDKPSGDSTVIGKGWDSIAVFKTSGGLPAKAPSNGKSSADALLNDFGKRVTGRFGSGTLFHTRLVNVLMTDKGTVYAGAVTQSALTGAADAAAK
jgi:outer membrane lipoprotein-sorting protein